MDLGLNIAATGMLAEQVRQDQLSNDLANAQTPGYKADVVEQTSFGSLLLSNRETGAPVGSIITDVRMGKTVTNLTPSSLQQTGQPLDFGIDGAGFYGVQTAQGIRYTRNGQFMASPAGLLTDSLGRNVLSQAGQPIRVDAQGKVPARALGVFNISNPLKQGDNLFTGTAVGGVTGSVRQGMLENSGVTAVGTMTDMIASLRAYEAGQKAIQSIDETLQQSSQTVGSVAG